jgi:hypothetical protein
MIFLFDYRTVMTVWYFRTVITQLWYFRTVMTVWYFRTVMTVWYFRTVLTVWYFRTVSQIVGQDFIVLDFFHGRKILKVDGRDGRGPQNREKNAPTGRFTCMPMTHS